MSPNDPDVGARVPKINIIMASWIKLILSDRVAELSSRLGLAAGFSSLIYASGNQSVLWLFRSTTTFHRGSYASSKWRLVWLECVVLSRARGSLSALLTWPRITWSSTYIVSPGFIWPAGCHVSVLCNPVLSDLFDAILLSVSGTLAHSLNVI